MNTNEHAARAGRYAVAVVALLILLGAITALAATGKFKRWFEPRPRPTPTLADASQPSRQLWTCGMHPQVIQDHPGKCPICHMELVPLKTDVANSHDGMPVVTIEPEVVQNMGVRTAEVTRGMLMTSVRTLGVFAEAEPRVHDVNLRVSGWVEKLYANSIGMHVKVGDPLFDLYSPQLQTAVEELIAARRAAASGPSGQLYESAQHKLLLLGLDKADVERLAKLDDAPRTVTFRSPVMGHVTEKPIVEGAAVKEGERALRIVDHSRLWLQVQIYESQLPLVNVGERATASVDAVPGRTFAGELTFIYPQVDPTRRTVMARIVVPNESMLLRPGMYATVQVESKVADEAVLAPREAIIDTGTEQIAFLAKPQGHFEPRKVKLGATSSDGNVQVLAGLQPGDTVVTSGQFLIDAESRMRAAIQKHLGHQQQSNQ